MHHLKSCAESLASARNKTHLKSHLKNGANRKLVLLAWNQMAS
jgi:hypothetical protein